MKTKIEQPQNFAKAFLLLLSLENKRIISEEFTQQKLDLVNALNLEHGYLFPCKYSSDVFKDDLICLYTLCAKWGH